MTTDQKGLFAPGKVSAIVGYPYSSKTPMALDIAIDLAMGAGNALTSLRTLYLATEGARNARRKAARIAKAKGTSLVELEQALTVASAPSGFLNAESCVRLIDNCRAEAYGALLLDTYGSALDGSIDRNSNAFSDCLKQLGDASDAYGLLVIVLLHCRKDKMRGNKPPSLQDIDGHNSVAGAIQGALALSRPSDDDKALIEVSCLRAPDEEFESYCVRWEDVAGAGGEGLRCTLEAAPGGKGLLADAKRAELAAIEAETVRRVLAAIDREGFTTTRAVRDMSTGLGREGKSQLLAKLQREGVIVLETAGSSERISRPLPSPRSAEALAKRTGFLAGGPRGNVERPAQYREDILHAGVGQVKESAP